MFDGVKNTYLVEVTVTSSKFEYVKSDKKYYLDVLSDDGIIVPIRTKNKETIDKLIAIKPQETMHFIGNGVEIPNSIKETYRKLYSDKKISNIGLEEISIFRQLVPLAIGIIILVVILILNIYSKKDIKIIFNTYKNIHF